MKQLFQNVRTNFIYHEDVVPILLKVIKLKGVLNLGGKSQSIYNFVKKENKNIKKFF